MILPQLAPTMASSHDIGSHQLLTPPMSRSLGDNLRSRRCPASQSYFLTVGNVPAISTGQPRHELLPSFAEEKYGLTISPSISIPSNQHMVPSGTACLQVRGYPFVFWLTLILASEYSTIFCCISNPSIQMHTEQLHHSDFTNYYRDPY